MTNDVEIKALKLAASDCRKQAVKTAAPTDRLYMELLAARYEAQIAGLECSRSVEQIQHQFAAPICRVAQAN